MGGVVDALHGGSGEHDQGRRTEADPAMADRDDDGAGEGHNSADDAARARALVEERHGEHDAEDGGGGDQQAGGAGGNHAFASVEKQLVGRHPGQAAEGDQGEVADRRAPYADERGHECQGDRGHEEPGHREPGRTELGDRDPDRRKRAGPQGDGDGQGQSWRRGDPEGHTTSIDVTYRKVQFQ